MTIAGKMSYPALFTTTSEQKDIQFNDLSCSSWCEYKRWWWMTCNTETMLTYSSKLVQGCLDQFFSVFYRICVWRTERVTDTISTAMNLQSFCIGRVSVTIIWLTGRQTRVDDSHLASVLRNNQWSAFQNNIVIDPSFSCLLWWLCIFSQICEVHRADRRGEKHLSPIPANSFIREYSDRQQSILAILTLPLQYMH